MALISMGRVCLLIVGMATNTCAITPVVDVLPSSVSECFTTYRLSIQHTGHSIHTIFGTPEQPLYLPAAFQVTQNRGGVNVGGINPAMYAGNPDLEYDSWLTIGDGSSLNTRGMDPWSADVNLASSDAFVSRFDNEHGLSPDTNRTVVVGQITLRNEVSTNVILNVQGHSQDRSAEVQFQDMIPDWQEFGFNFALANPGAETCAGALDDAVTPEVQIMSNPDPCYTTYRLFMSHEQYSIHTIYGTPEQPLILPAATQIASAQGGVDVGGVSDAIIAQLPDAGLQFDSWLTVGTTTGSDDLMTEGLDVWDSTTGLNSESAFVTRASSGVGTTGPTVVAQITMRSNAMATVSMNVRGHTQDRSGPVHYNTMTPDWQATGVTFELSDLESMRQTVGRTDCGPLPEAASTSVRSELSLNRNIEDITESVEALTAFKNEFKSSIASAT
eukprot:SAG31_NODE_6526_length_1988_cov_1.169931_1_plen_442_part_01